MSPTTKPCSVCKTEKPLTDFSPLAHGPLGRQPGCRPCRNAAARARAAARPGHDRDRAFRRRYGLTLEQAEQFLDAHGRRCAVCAKTTELHIDHCHATGRLRGVLCGSCNRALGLLKDDPVRIQGLLAYLERQPRPWDSLVAEVEYQRTVEPPVPVE